ncbi:transcription factor bHLH90-like [Chenopodium quinoa]|nr:transcription factor bHLH90-like [Chenopodium quinoa]
MCHLETALEWLRPLVLDSGIWDYCVLWKLGDDPSRFIEFLGCCCNGGGKQEMGLRKRIREKNNSMQFCRDVNYVHPAYTNSCQVLANLPQFMSIYSGLHGDVVLSCQPRWLTKKSDSKMSTEESCGTHVLIPVFGGLVELYSSKHVEEDESVIEYVKSQFNIYSELETMSTSTISFDGQSIDPFLDIKSNSGLSSLNQPNIPAWPQPSMLPSIAQRYSDSTLDGSSTGSFPSDEHPSPDSNPCSVSQDIPSKPLMACHKDPVIVQEKHGLKRGTGKSKNLLTERNRRQRINDGILSLRALVPKITKMHKAATLSDAIDYIEELNNEIKELQDELKSLIEEDSDEKHTLKLKADLGEKVSKPKQASSVTERLKANVQVNQLGNGNFLLRIICQQKPGVYTKLLEALSALGLPIKDANLTTYDGQVSTIFTVQSNKKEIREEDLRDSLSRLTA